MGMQKADISHTTTFFIPNLSSPLNEFRQSNICQFTFDISKSTMCVTITLIRHGETDDNVKEKQSSATDVELNSNGQRQGELLGVSLSDVRFDKVYTSDKKRTRQTALAILSKNKHGQIQESEIIQDEMLRERVIGDWEGISREESVKRVMEMGGFDPDNFNPPTWEHVSDFSKRIFDFLSKEIFSKVDSGELDGKEVMIVTHGMWIYQFLLDIPKMADQFELEGFSGVKRTMDNTERSTFRIYRVDGEEKRKIQFLIAQDSSHLKSS